MIHAKSIVTRSVLPIAVNLCTIAESLVNLTHSMIFLQISRSNVHDKIYNLEAP